MSTESPAYPQEWYDLARRASESPEGLELFVTAVLRAAVGKLNTIPVQCTALTGPVWYGQGFKEAIDLVADMGDAPNPWLADQLRGSPDTD